MIDLTKEELSLLLGGVMEITSLSTDEVTNINGTAGCICTYNNHPSIDNDNRVADCRCKCVYVR